MKSLRKHRDNRLVTTKRKNELFSVRTKLSIKNLLTIEIKNKTKQNKTKKNKTKKHKYS